MAQKQTQTIFTIVRESAIVNGVDTGARWVIVDEWGCWLASPRPDGSIRKFTINGKHVKAPAGWSSGAER